MSMKKESCHHLVPSKHTYIGSSASTWTVARSVGKSEGERLEVMAMLRSKGEGACGCWPLLNPSNGDVPRWLTGEGQLEWQSRSLLSLIVSEGGGATVADRSVPVVLVRFFKHHLLCLPASLESKLSTVLIDFNSDFLLPFCWAWSRW